MDGCSKSFSRGLRVLWHCCCFVRRHLILVQDLLQADLRVQGSVQLVGTGPARFQASGRCLELVDRTRCRRPSGKEPYRMWADMMKRAWPNLAACSKSIARDKV